ncbi:hypothetical protein D9757_001387 [Collybiopsis confluens]|uniref:Uncharacterized protein n=1 Tax=Collybiopsis confluens TaxID=2823264 RepID=A0A8H5HZE7_9AGAR|nr:hypothetical protein D9757_001387 [Collybiopsis confluens]
MSLLSNLNKRAANVKKTTIGLNKRKGTVIEEDGQIVAAETSITEVTVAGPGAMETSITEVTVAEVAEVNTEGDTETVNAITYRSRESFTQLRGTDFLSSSKSDGTEIQVETAVDQKLESVYIVLRPLKLADAPEAGLKKLGRLVKAVEFENYLLLQHWGVLVGNKYYHLHTDDEKRLSVSLIPFIDIENDIHQHTIKIPIWRTQLTHDERVGVGIIKAMGDFNEESEVEITDEHGKIIMADSEDRQRFRMEGRYLRPPIPLSIFKGGYNALSNNCIHFTKHYIFDQLLLRRNGVGLWHPISTGSKSPSELAKHLAGILGVVNPFALTPRNGAKILIKILCIFLDIPYDASLDEKTAQNPSNKALNSDGSTTIAGEGET